MVQENLEKIRTEDKKSYKKFLIVLIAAGLIGGVAGFFLSAGENFMTASGLSFVELWSDIQTGLVVPFRFITMIAGAVFWIISAIFYKFIQYFFFMFIILHCHSINCINQNMIKYQFTYYIIITQIEFF